VSDVAIAIVCGLRDKDRIPRLEGPTAFADEVDLWGIGVLWVGHWDEAVEDVDPDASTKGYIAFVCPQARYQPSVHERAH
jgi:hypothetical protein